MLLNMWFLLNYICKQTKAEDFGGAKCHKFNIVGGSREMDLELAQFIAEDRIKN